MGDFWGCLGASCRCLAASWAKRVEKGRPKAAQESPKEHWIGQKSSPREAQQGQEAPRETPKSPREAQEAPREVRKTLKEFEGVPESTQDKLRKHHESKSARKQPNTAPPKNL